MLAVAVHEELYFRGFPLFTLSRGQGFWPAAVLLSLYFGGLHYLGKPNERELTGRLLVITDHGICLR